MALTHGVGLSPTIYTVSGWGEDVIATMQLAHAVGPWNSVRRRELGIEGAMHSLPRFKLWRLSW